MQTEQINEIVKFFSQKQVFINEIIDKQANLMLLNNIISMIFFILFSIFFIKFINKIKIEAKNMEMHFFDYLNSDMDNNIFKTLCFILTSFIEFLWLIFAIANILTIVGLLYNPTFTVIRHLIK